MDENYNILIRKLDDFIRKYYKNQIIRGALLSASIYLVFFLSTVVSEYYGHFSIAVRTIIFYISFLLFLVVFVRFIFIPVLQFFKIGRIISYKQAAQILAAHFNRLQDKLHNTLELADLENMNVFSRELVIASINQRIFELKPIPFNAAVNFRENLKYLKYLAGLAILVLIIFIFWPSVITEGTQRIIKHATYFESEAPYQFILLNDSLFVQKGRNYQVKMEVRGSYVPENVSIAFGNNNFLMSKISKSKFSYTFKSINNSVDFYFLAETYTSKKYRLQVLPSPVIIDFNIMVDVPAYTKDTNKIYNNVGDITVPCGSKVKWTFNTKDIDSLWVIFNDTVKYSASRDNNGFAVSKSFLQSMNYKVAVANKFFNKNEFVKYSVNVIPDLAPGIKVNNIKDSAKFSAFYFNGLINDDYGFGKLTFNIKTVHDKSDIVKDSLFSVNIPVNKNTTSHEFYYSFDFSSINISDKRKIEYYFEVWDNDAVNGSKSARSSVYEFIIPTKDEIQKIEDQTAKNLQDKLSQSMKLAKELKRDINNMQESLINKNLSSWDKTKMMEQISSKQNQLNELTQQISKEFKQKNEMMNSLTEKEKEILEKQKQLQELLNNVMTDDLKKMMEELNKLMQDYDKKKINELSKDIKLSMDDLSKQLDRNMELLKKYELEKKIDNTIDRIDKLADDQEKLSEKTGDKNAEQDKESLSEKQNEQSGEFDKISQEYQDIQDQNKELKSPMKLDDKEEEMKSIKEDFKQGNQNMKENKMNKASKKQKETSKKLKNMAGSMKQMMQQCQAAQQEEDMDALRKILENLITFSFDQEALMGVLKDIQPRNPKYVEVVSQQKNLAESYKVIKDSLTALAKRTPQIKSVINKEQASLERYMEKTLDGLGERNVGQARTNQQLVMTSANNLALLLSEALNQMQNQMDGMSDSQCSKPKKGGKGKKQSLQSMRQQQESLKSQMEQMINQLKNGKKDGNGSYNPNSMNKQLSKMLAQQEIFQQMLNDITSNSTINPQAQKALNEIKSLLDKNQTDLVNKNITPETLKRQNLIVTRLLEAENSEYQREIDNKRESKEAKNENFSNPEQFFKYKGINSKFNEMLNTSGLKLYKYYKNKYKEYLIKLNEN
ncbi:MAG: hypothetical protein HY958_14640 [Bacteroidia bacterium]|nr:hypothetical protein [Bacteroidia bacterium]